MSEEQKQQAEKISAEINKLTPEMVQPAKSEKKEA